MDFGHKTLPEILEKAFSAKSNPEIVYYGHDVEEISDEYIKLGHASAPISHLHNKWSELVEIIRALKKKLDMEEQSSFKYNLIEAEFDFIENQIIFLENSMLCLLQEELHVTEEAFENIIFSEDWDMYVPKHCTMDQNDETDAIARQIDGDLYHTNKGYLH